MTTTPPQDQPAPRIDSKLGATALRAPAASREDSRPQAILKLQPRNSFDYRVHYEPQLTNHMLALNFLPAYQKKFKYGSILMQLLES